MLHPAWSSTGLTTRTARRYNHTTGCITLTTERHAHREDNRREVLRWLHLLIAEGHRAYPAEPRPELGLAWGPDGRRIDIPPTVDPDERLDSDDEYGIGAEHASHAEYANHAKHPSDPEYASDAEHGSDAGPGQSERGERERVEGSQVSEGEHPGDRASGGEAATKPGVGAAAHMDKVPHGDAAPGEDVAGPRADAGLGSDAGERAGAAHPDESGVATSGEGDGSRGSRRRVHSAAAAENPEGSAANGEAATSFVADQGLRKARGGRAR